jgi:hypothetical protein
LNPQVVERVPTEVGTCCESGHNESNAVSRFSSVMTHASSFETSTFVRSDETVFPRLKCGLWRRFTARVPQLIEDGVA